MKSAIWARFCVMAVSAALSMPAVAQDKKQCTDLMKKLNSTEQDIVYIKALESLVENSHRYVEYGKKLKELLSAETLKLISDYEIENSNLRNNYTNTVNEYKALYQAANGSYPQLYYDKMKQLNEEVEAKRRVFNKTWNKPVFESLDKDMKTDFMEAALGMPTLQSRQHNYNLPTVFLTPMGYESFEKKDTYNKGKASMFGFQLVAVAYRKDLGKGKQRVGLEIELDTNPFVITAKESEDKYGVLQLTYDVLNDQERIFFFRNDKIQLKNKKDILAALRQQRADLQLEAIASGELKQNLVIALMCVDDLDIYSFLPDAKLPWGSKENKSVKTYDQIYERN